jgi:hypothetical protein
VTVLVSYSVTETGRVCNDATLNIDYGAVITGIRGIGPGVTEMFVGTSLRTYDGNGGFSDTGSFHGANTGVQNGGPVSGTYHVNPDCTGTSTLLLPAPVGPIESSFVIVDNGKEVWEESCRQHRISSPQNCGKSDVCQTCGTDLMDITAGKFEMSQPSILAIGRTGKRLSDRH